MSKHMTRLNSVAHNMPTHLKTWKRLLGFLDLLMSKTIKKHKSLKRTSDSNPARKVSMSHFKEMRFYVFSNSKGQFFI